MRLVKQLWCDLCDDPAVKKVLTKGTTVQPIMTAHFCADHRSEMLEFAERNDGAVVDADWEGSLAAAARLIIVSKVMRD